MEDAGKEGINTGYTLKSILKFTGKLYPSKNRQRAHRIADRAEAAKFGKTKYKKMENLVRHFPAGELLGKNTKTGKIQISKKVPVKMRREVAYNESVFFKALHRRT